MQITSRMFVRHCEVLDQIMGIGIPNYTWLYRLYIISNYFSDVYTTKNLTQNKLRFITISLKLYKMLIR